ncbi:uncharacterized protein LOC126775018 [Nymphalis io]|uniref:uncharacterized protein LOC126775018 n=1 Tax=Inachis io TaxID=171585 RepID=UPI002168947B|nr:uncharacterized protein LOC126775018 [Nymphalis io]
MAQSSNVVFPRKLLKKFILMYRELNCLWDRKCLTYKHKKKRHDAVTKLTELVQKYDSSATRVHVLRKIESLRACVRREYKKIQDSRLQATSPDEVYTPHLWYYDMLSFVFGEEESNLKEKQESPEPVISESEDEIETRESDETFQPPIVNYSDYTVTTNLMEGGNVSPIPKPFEFEEDKSKRHCTEVDDEYDAIGINVAAKLRGLPSNVRILAEKLINDVLYQAQMNGLNSTTVITTPDPFKQDVL